MNETDRSRIAPRPLSRSRCNPLPVEWDSEGLSAGGWAAAARRARPHTGCAHMGRDGKKDEDEAYDPFAGLDKGSVLQVWVTR